MIEASDARQVAANTLDLAGSGVYDGTIHEKLGIRILEATPDKVVLEMDVGPAVYQPFGLLHGGASATIAESAASIGAYLSSDYENGEYSVGVDLNITHLRARRDGKVVATATPIRRGRTTHVWGIDLVDENGEMVAVARCTLAIRSAKKV
ncbi:MAG TPA: PaaI family thioesterase [Actinomycetota bacterium]|nr:PaaI family thioesterase [Actinomycetota bacterium]